MRKFALAAALVLAAPAPYAFAATAISTCQIISTAGNYVLTQNLTYTGTPAPGCIFIEVPNVALDLGGHTITGNGTGSGVTNGGIYSDSYVVISHGTIQGFSLGINFVGAGNNAAINNVTVKNNKSDGIDFDYLASSLTGVTSADNAGRGIYDPNPFTIYNGVTVSGNGGDGIFTSGASNDEFTNIAAANNGGIGLNLGNGSSNFITSSTVSGNAGGGVAMGGSNTVSGSIVENNKGDGIYGSGSGDNEVTASRVSNNTSHGIEWVIGADFVSNSMVNNNGGDGVHLDPTPA
jgi:parallel beta-helix repeat protein